MTKKKMQIGLFFFVYSLFAGLVIQLILIPFFFHHLDLGNGIVILDSYGFDYWARLKTNEILQKGWSAWELRPRSHLPIGMASFFYSIWAPKPYTLLPINSLIHTLSGCLVLWILLRFFSWNAALCGTFLFVFNPASLQWVAQIHRDGIFILGNLLVLCSVVQLGSALMTSKFRGIVGGVLGGLTGTLFVWSSRTYWMHELFIFVFLGGVIVSFFCLTKNGLSSDEMNKKKYVLSGIFIILLFQGWLMGYHSVETTELPGDNDGQRSRTIPISIKSKSVITPSAPMLMPTVNTVEVENPLWVRTIGVPKIIEKKLYQISSVRQGVIATGGNTVVDREVRLNSVGAFGAYLPRALQLGLLSPLPVFWSGEGSTPLMTIARKVVGGITIFFYVCLLGALAGIVRFWRNHEAWIVILFSFLGILVFAYTYPNVGTLLRFRYGFYMLLVAFGAATIIDALFGCVRTRQTIIPESIGMGCNFMREVSKREPS